VVVVVYTEILLESQLEQEVLEEAETQLFNHLLMEELLVAMLLQIPEAVVAVVQAFLR
jgi:hypothetical protein